MVGDDLTRLWKAHDLCQSEDAIFAAAGVCDGYLPGVKVEATTPPPTTNSSTSPRTAW